VGGAGVGAGAYLVVLWLTTFAWFGVAPPGWLPRRPDPPA